MCGLTRLALLTSNHACTRLKWIVLYPTVNNRYVIPQSVAGHELPIAGKPGDTHQHDPGSDEYLEASLDLHGDMRSEQAKRRHVRLGRRPHRVKMGMMPPRRLRWGLSLNHGSGRHLAVHGGYRIFVPDGEQLARSGQVLLRAQQLARVFEPHRGIRLFAALQSNGPKPRLPTIEPTSHPLLPLVERARPLFDFVHPLGGQDENLLPA